MRVLLGMVLLLGALFSQDARLLESLSQEERAFLAEHPVIRIGNDINWPPVDYIDKEGRHRGMTADYMALLSERLGVRFEPVRDRPWHEVVELAKARQIDLFACAVATPEREAYMRFTRPYLYFPVVVVTSDQVSYLRNLSDLKGRTIGVAKGYATHEILQTHYPHLELIVFDSSREGLQAVSQGRAFAFIGTIATMGYEIRQAGLTEPDPKNQTTS